MPKSKKVRGIKRNLLTRLIKWLVKHPIHVSGVVFGFIFVFVGGLNDIVEFVQRWPENKELYLTIAGIIIFFTIIVGLIIYLRKYKSKLFHKYFKPEYAIILFAIFILGYWRYTIWQSEIDKDKTRIVVTEFLGENQLNSQVTQEILLQLNQAFSNEKGLEIIYIDKTILEQDGSKVARELGSRYLADLVFWGRYQYDNRGNIHITGHIENLTEDEILPESIVYKPNLKDIDSVTFTEEFSDEMTSIALLTRGIVHYGSGDCNKVVDLLSEIVKDDDPSSEIIDMDKVHLLLGNCWLVLQRFSTAEEAYLQAETIANNNNRTPFEEYHNLGFLYFSSNDTEQSIEYLSKAIEAKPDSVETYRIRGMVYTTTWNYKDASSDLSFVIDMNPSAENYVFRGFMYFFLNDLYAAETDAYKAIQINGNLHSAYTLLGAIKSYQGDQVNANAYLIKASQLSNESDESKFHILGPPIYLYPIKNSSTEDKVKEALSELTNNLQYLGQQQYFLSIGRANFMKGEIYYDLALSNFDSVIGINKDSIFSLMAYTTKGIILNSQGRFIEAIPNFERAIEIYNTSSDASIKQNFEGGFVFFPFYDNDRTVFFILAQIGIGSSHSGLGDFDVAKGEFDEAHSSISNFMITYDSGKASLGHNQLISLLYGSLAEGFESLDCNNPKSFDNKIFDNYYTSSIHLYNKALEFNPNQPLIYLHLQMPCIGKEIP